MSLISKDMVIGDVIRKYPRTERVFITYGMSCSGCMGALGETVEGGARMHSIDLVSLIEDLNRAVAIDPTLESPRSS